MPHRVVSKRAPLPSRRNARRKRRALGAGVVEELKSSRSAWPVRTGRSKRGFGYSISSVVVNITNTRKYAIYVEHGTRHQRAQRVVTKVLNKHLRAFAAVEREEVKLLKEARERRAKAFRDSGGLVIQFVGGQRQNRLRRIRRFRNRIIAGSAILSLGEL